MFTTWIVCWQSLIETNIPEELQEWAVWRYWDYRGFVLHWLLSHRLKHRTAISQVPVQRISENPSYAELCFSNELLLILVFFAVKKEKGENRIRILKYLNLKLLLGFQIRPWYYTVSWKCKRPPAFLKISHARFCIIRPWLGSISAFSLPPPFCHLSSTLLYSHLSLPTLRLTLFLAHYKFGPQTCHL